MKIDLTKPLPKSADAADFLESGITWTDFHAWAKPRTHVYEPQKQNIEIIQTSAVDKTPQAIAAAQANIQINIPDPEDPGAVNDGQLALWERIGIARTSNGNPICNMDNVKRVFEGLALFKDFAWYDEFHERIFTNWGTFKTRELSDSIIINIVGFLQRRIGISRITKENVYQAIVDYAYERKRNAPREWMESLVWDGTGRIESFFIDYFDSEDNDYTRAVGRNLWIAMVARIYRPGCKFDHLVYLQGPQSIGKSTAWEDVGGEWYSSASYGLTDKDFLLALKGKLVVELSELTSVKRADINSIKEIITRRVDNYQIRYERMTNDHPRQCVFVGTTNDDLLIPDNTGARRFWPIKCRSKIHNELIRQNRDQLFAEAVARFKKGESWWDMPSELTKSVQDELRNADIWEDKIRDYLVEKTEVTSTEILDSLGRRVIGELTQSDKNRVAGVMKLLGWVNKPKWKDGKSVRVWTLKDCNGEASEML